MNPSKPLGDERACNLGGQLILRDRLAENRTVLANQRTLLAYVRTALTFFAAGVTFIKFFRDPSLEMLGWVFIPVAAFTLARGIITYRDMIQVIQAEEDQI